MPIRQGELPLYTFRSLDDPTVAHGVSTRAGGVSEGPYASLNLGASVGDDPERVDENRARLAGALGFEADRLVTTPQVHGDGVMVIDDSNADQALTTRADILLTTQAGHLLMQRFADCVPLLFWHRSARAVAVAHAGWRGTALGVAARTVAALWEHAGAEPSKLLAAIGPSIGPCCFEVGAEVVAQFPRADGAMRMGARGRPHLDLWELNRRSLVEAGVPPERVEVARICTRCRPETFFSHRALGYPAGRFGGAIGLRVDA
jgi:YfiH family protein